MDNETRGIIEDVLQNNHVVVFMKGRRAQPECGFSAKTVATLDMLLPEYVDVNVLEHPNIRDGIKAYGNWPTIPQIYVDGELMGGADIVVEMFQSGELAKALGLETPAVSTPRVEIDDGVAALVRETLEQHPDVVIHLRVNARWQHTLSVAPPDPQEISVTVNGVELYLDPWTAARSDGLQIRMDEGLQGNRFHFDNPNAPPPIQSMTVTTLKAHLDAGDALQLIDVRPPAEQALAAIAGARSWDEETEKALEAMPRDTMVVVYCHTGRSSLKIAGHLRNRGFRNIHNLAGGIDAWSQEVDPSTPRY